MQNGEMELKQWISATLGSQDYSFAPLPGDASFRTYFRVRHEDKNYIVMLAPPTKERTDAFVAIGKAWHQHGIQVPHILAWEQTQGFVLLSDFGDRLLLDILAEETADAFYHHAMQSIVQLQSATVSGYALPPYNEAFVRLELGYFTEWFLEKFLGLIPQAEEAKILMDAFNRIVANFTSQPQVIVHRDYHSRNLMVLENETLGIIDFQDAMEGPITYDLVSLLKDCYITFGAYKVNHWVEQFYEMLIAHKRIPRGDFQLFLKWFDLVGLQRHIKVLGNFSRLKLRDNKPHYLIHLPRIMNYILEVTKKYPAFTDFHHYMQLKVSPLMFEALAQHNIALDTEVKVA